MEITALERDMQIQSYRQQPDELESSLSIGLQPQAEVPSTFLADAAEYRASVLPGWTPSSQFYDDFTVIPGGVGSSWTVATTGAGTVSQPSAGIARLDSPSAGAAAKITALGTGIGDVGAGNVFCAFRAKLPVLTGSGLARGGLADGSLGNGYLVGVNTFNAHFHSVTSNSVAVRFVASEVETNDYHVFRMWWKQSGYPTGAVDDSAYAQSRQGGSGTRFPVVQLVNSASRMDLTHFVVWS